MVVGGYCFADSRRSRAREIVRSGAKERGEGGDSILGLTEGLTEAAGIKAGRDGGGLCRGGSAMLPCPAKLGGAGRQGTRVGAEARLQEVTSRRAGHF
jgi:hypothetical protein